MNGHTELDAITLLVEADKAGTEWATGLKVGDKFKGAAVEAEKRYGHGGSLYSMFLNSALDVLDTKYLQLDSAGRITRYYDLGLGERVKETT